MSFIINPYRFGGGGGGDPDFANVSLLLPLNGTNGGASFPDESNNGFTVTGFGNAQTTTAQSKWGGSSLVLDGSGDYLSVPDNAAFDFGTGDFTIEFWLRRSSYVNFQVIYEHGYVSAGAFLIIANQSDGRLFVYCSGSIVAQESDGLALDTWAFYQIVRSGTTVIIYRDGVSKGSGSDSTNLGVNADVGIGIRLSDGNYGYNGYMQDLRVTKGVARPNVVPTAAFPTF